MDTTVEHLPVLTSESLELLQVKREGVYVDCTVGLGGHAEKILSRLEGTGRLVALDRDPEGLEIARNRLKGIKNAECYHENFRNLPLILNQLGIAKIDGCLVDLGVSSYQLAQPERGFSFRQEGPLDMRMDRQQKSSAADLVNELSESKLVEIFRRYGEEPAAKRIAAAIVKRRKMAKLRTTAQLAELVERVKGSRRGSRLHPATRIFQALRIEVNQELAALEEFLAVAVGHLAEKARLVVISFHSLEDRLVKTVFKKEAGRCVCFRPAELCICPRKENVRILTKRPVKPSLEEIEQNPRARSAKLRAVEKCAGALPISQDRNP